MWRVPPLALRGVALRLLVGGKRRIFQVMVALRRVDRGYLKRFLVPMGVRSYLIPATIVAAHVREKRPLLPTAVPNYLILAALVAARVLKKRKIPSHQCVFFVLWRDYLDANDPSTVFFDLLKILPLAEISATPGFLIVCLCSVHLE